MAYAILAMGVPVVAGVAVDQTLRGVLASLGGVLATLADRVGPYPSRVRRIVAVGVVGGVGGLSIGTAVNGHGWLIVPVMVAIAGLSALISVLGAIGSAAGMFLLAYGALATGPIGAVRPWWLAPVWLLIGIGWSVALLVPGWLLHPRTVQQQRVAAAYRALAADLRAPGPEMFGPSHQALVGALNVAYEELFHERVAIDGRDRRLSELVGLLDQAREMAHASVALAYRGEQLPPEVAAQTQAIAEAVLGGPAVGQLTPPSTTGPETAALYAALNAASQRTSGRRGTASPPVEVVSPVPGRRARLDDSVGQLRGGLTSTFSLRLMLCIGVAAAISTILPLQRAYWVMLAVAVVMKPDFGSVFARAVQYGVGTVLGALIAALVLAAQPPSWALLLPIVLFGALLPYGMGRQYGLFAVFFTPAVVFLIELISPGGWSLAEYRLIDITVGCGIVLGVGYFPWASSWHTSLVRSFAQVLDDSAEYAEQTLGAGIPIRAASAHTRARARLPLLRTEVQRTLSEPGRIRQDVTAWLPAIVDLERLIEAITATAVTGVGEPTPREAIRALATSMRQLAAHVRSNSRVGLSQPVSTPESLQLVKDALRSLQDTLTATPPLGGPHGHHPLLSLRPT
jgi:uncharacterized membrane protein YccC